MKKLILVTVLVIGLAACGGKGTPEMMAETEPAAVEAAAETAGAPSEPVESGGAAASATPAPPATPTQTPVPTATPQLSLSSTNFKQFVQVHAFDETISSQLGRDLFDLRLDEIAYSTDGQRIAVGICTYSGSGSCISPYHPGESYVLVLNALTGEIVADLPIKKVNLSSLALSPAGDKLYVAENPVKLSVWDVASGKKEQELHRENRNYSNLSFAVSPDGSQLAAAFSRGLWVWDTASRKLVFQNSTDWEEYQAQYSGDGQRLMVSSRFGKGNMTVFETAGWEKVVEINYGNELGYFSAISPDSRLIASPGGSRNEIMLWDAATGEQLGSLVEGFDYITGIAFSPDSQLLLVGGIASWENLYDTLGIWDVAGRQRLGGAYVDITAKEIIFSQDGDGFIVAATKQIPLIYRWSLPDENLLKVRAGIVAYLKALSEADYATAGNLLEIEEDLKDYFATKGVGTSDPVTLLEYACEVAGHHCDLTVYEWIFEGMGYNGSYQALVRLVRPDGSIFLDANGDDQFWIYAKILEDGTVKVTSLPEFPYSD
ncbi:MAG: hypothetical protein OEZ02_07000 [Anaerolineae bacterium]|nr:hypothetical protein [Anaerolineae bacterium]